MKQIILLSFFTIFGISQLLAQEDLSTRSNTDSNTGTNIFANSIGLAIGLNTGAFKDLHFSPLHYRELGPVYNFNYRRKKDNKKHLFSTDLFFSNGQTTTKVSDSLETRYLMGDINITYLRQLPKTKNKFDFYLGTAYHLDFNFIIFNNVFESFTFLIAHNLDLKGEVHYQLNEKSQLRGSLALPAITLLVRPPFSGYNDELDKNQERPLRLITNGNFVTLNKYARLFFNLKYQYFFTPKWNIETSYAFNYIRHSEFKQFQNQLFAGLNFKF